MNSTAKSVLAPTIPAPNVSPTRPRARVVFRVPDDPLITIEPSGALTLGLADLWAYRELVYFLTWRDIKVRYKQTVLGIAWAILQPLLTMILFSIFFGRLASVPSDNIPYPVFALAGLLPWTFFANALSSSTNSIVGSANLITKIYFPRMMIPGAAIAANLMDFALASLTLVGLMAYYRMSVTWSVLMLAPLIVLIALLSVAVGLWMSAMNVRYRDVRYALPFLVQLWMFASPIIYPLSMVPEKWRWVLVLNPLTGIIEGFRAALFAGTRFNWGALAFSTVITLLFLVYSAYAFRKVEKTFADIV